MNAIGFAMKYGRRKMANKAKLTAQYFPHYAQQKKTVPLLKAKFGSDGYSFWYQLLERLCEAKGHFIDCSKPGDFDFLCLTQIGIAVEKSELILRELLFRGKIDRDLWESDRIIWCQGLVDNLTETLYSKRQLKPEKPKAGKQSDLFPDNHQLSGNNAIDSTIKTGSEVNRSELNRREVKGAAEASPEDPSDLLEGMENLRPSRQPARRQPRSMAVVRYHEITSKWPNAVQMSAIDETILTDADVDTWEVVIKTWLMRGHNPMGVEGMLDWFRTGIPRNGKRPQQVANVADDSRFDEFKRLEQEQKRKEAEKAEEGD